MCCAITALAVGHDLALGADAGPHVHLLQLIGGLERAVGCEVVRPLEMNGPGDSAAARGSYCRAAIFAVAARIDDDRVLTTEAIVHVAPARENRFVARAGPVGRLRLGRQLCDRQAFSTPRVEAAIEQARVRMAEKFEKPERACRSNA